MRRRHRRREQEGKGEQGERKCTGMEVTTPWKYYRIFTEHARQVRLGHCLRAESPAYDPRQITPAERRRGHWLRYRRLGGSAGGISDRGDHQRGRLSTHRGPLWAFQYGCNWLQAAARGRRLFSGGMRRECCPGRTQLRLRSWRGTLSPLDR